MFFKKNPDILDKSCWNVGPPEYTTTLKYTDFCMIPELEEISGDDLSQPLFLRLLPKFSVIDDCSQGVENSIITFDNLL